MENAVPSPKAWNSASASAPGSSRIHVDDGFGRRVQWAIAGSGQPTVVVPPIPTTSNAPSASVVPGAIGATTVISPERDAAPATARATNESSVSRFHHDELSMTAAGRVCPALTPAKRGMSRIPGRPSFRRPPVTV